MKLGFSALTWQHSWLCLGHSPPTLSQGVISSMWALQRSASGLLWGRCGENPKQLTVCQESLVCGVQASGTGSSDCMGLWFPCHFCLLEKPLRSSFSCWDTGLVTRRLRAIWRRLGLCWFSLTGQGPTSSSLRQVMGLKTPVLEGKMMFSQGVWGPRDHLQHQRLIVQGVSSWHFVSCQLSKAGSWDSANSTSILGKCVLLHPRRACGWSPYQALKITAMSSGPQQSMPCCRVCCWCSEKGHMVLFTLCARDAQDMSASSYFTLNTYSLLTFPLLSDTSGLCTA